jgi:hypothetical protein
MVPKGGKNIRGDHQEIWVGSYSGYRVDERPLHFILEGRKYIVKRVLDRWREPDNDLFRVETEEGEVHMLRREREMGRWYVVRKK